MKIKVSHSVTITVSALGESSFGKPLMQKLEEKAKSLGCGHACLDPKNCTFTFHNTPIEHIQALKTDFKNIVVMLIEHGPNAEILEQLLNKHPELRTHPKLKDVVGAFENLNTVVSGVLGDRSNRTLAEISRREAEGVTELDEDDLLAQKRTKTTMEAADRAAFRDQARLGQTEEQKAAAPAVGDKKATIPPIYAKIAAQQQQKNGGGVESIGDRGNVFGG